MRKMIFIAMLMMLATIALMAHPAGKVNVSWDAKTQSLGVDFEHKVRDAADHFVYNITIQVNGKKALEQILPLQESGDGGSFVYKMPGLKKGDKVNVVTDCNKGGKKSATITIP